MAASPDWRIYSSSQLLATALATEVARILSAAIKDRGTALLAVSGGTTPGLFFDALSQLPLEWQRVIVTLVDERLVPESSPRSNAALVRSRLLRGAANAARLVELYREDGNAEEAATAASAELSDLPLPLDAAILGMGTDGHTASFFPDSGNLDALLDPASQAAVLPVHARSAGEPRLTLSLARLLEARFLALHIEGVEKRTVLEKALAPGADLPVSAVFAHAERPVPVYWAG